MVNVRLHRPRRLGAALITTAAVAGALPASALADSCPAQPVTQAFAALGDDNNYFMAPGGDFEGPDVWEHSGKSKIDDKNDTYQDISGKKALTLEEGSYSTSPELCVDVDRPHLRLVLKAKKGKGTLRVDAVSVSGDVTTLATIDGDEDKHWRISEFVPLTGPLGIQGDTVENVRLRITAETKAWQVDGVAVDPRVR